MLRGLFPHACALLFTTLVACGPSDGRPDGVVMDEPSDEEATALRQAYIDAQAQPVCTPRDVSECRYYYRDLDGRLQCPMSFRICSDVGRWLPCGEYRFDWEGGIAENR